MIICGAFRSITKHPQQRCQCSAVLVKNSLNAGFIVSNYATKFPEALQQLATWLQEENGLHGNGGRRFRSDSTGVH
jgi:NADPH-dependent curcumin reductase CurA